MKFAQLPQSAELRMLADLLDEMNVATQAIYRADLDGEAIDVFINPQSFVNALGGLDDMEARLGIPSNTCHAFREFLTLRAARMIIAGDLPSMDFDSLTESQGLDTSFVWTPKTLAPYVLNEAQARLAEGLCE